MNLKDKLIAAAFLLSSAVSSADTNFRTSIFINDVDVPKELKHHLAEFVYACENTNNSGRCRHNLRALESIEYVDKMKDSTVGQCWVCPNGDRHILILKDYADPNSMRIKSLMYHELGHCLLDLEHKPGENIMRPIIVDPEGGDRQWHKMLKEFYEQEPNKKYMEEKEDEDDKIRQKADENNPC